MPIYTVLLEAGSTEGILRSNYVQYESYEAFVQEQDNDYPLYRAFLTTDVPQLEEYEPLDINFVLKLNKTQTDEADGKIFLRS